MKISAYCSFSYLEKITTSAPIDLLDPANLSLAKSNIDLLELLTGGIRLKTDVSKEKITENQSNPYIKFLIKNHSIDSAEEDFKSIRINHNQFFTSDIKQISAYLLPINDEKLRIDLENSSGYHFLSASLDPGILFQEEVEHFKKAEKKDWSFASKYIGPHHSVIIADPYLYKEKTMESLKQFFKQITPRQLQGTYHVTLIGANERRDLSSSDNRINDLVNKLRKEIDSISNIAVVESFICNIEEFHDRLIITNNCCVFPGFGMDIINNGESKKESTWVAIKPFKKINLNGAKGILAIKLMKNKIEILKKWIEKGTGHTSNNPLFKIIDQ